MGLRTLLQLTHELLREVNSPVQRATVYDAQQGINDSYRDILQFYNWVWLLDRYDLNLWEGYGTGTVSVVVGSTAVTGVGTTWDVNWWNRKLLVGNTNAGLEIAQVTSPTTLTLRFPYQAGSNLVNSAYTMYQDDYPLPIVSGRDLICINPAWQNSRLDKVDRFTFDDRTQFQNFMALQGPVIFTDSGTDPYTNSPTYQMPRFQFWPIPNAAQILMFRYYRIPPPLTNNADTTVLPPEFEEILIKLGRYRIKKKYGIPGWMEDQKTAMQTLVQFREKQAAQTGYDQQPGSVVWPYVDPYQLDLAIGVWPGRLNP